MKDKADRIFYDLVNSPDDGGWYGDVWDGNCKDLLTTNTFLIKYHAQRAVLDKYPNAELMKVFG